MDNAVALVQAYLNVNGYFTVAEYPVIDATRNRGYRTATDLDVLAFRFPGAGRLQGANHRAEADAALETDPVLRCSERRAEMLVAEVKEGRAEPNEAIWDPLVLEAMLTRFGCCGRHEALEVVRCLLQRGRAVTPCGHLVRLVVFGSTAGDPHPARYDVIALAHVVEFLERHLREHWDVFRNVQFKDPAFGFLATLRKAHQGVAA